MAHITTEIPDELKAWVDNRIQSGYFISADDYMRSLIRSDLAAVARRFEELMLEGVYSDKHLGDDQFWDNRHANLQKNIGNQ